MKKIINICSSLLFAVADVPLFRAVARFVNKRVKPKGCYRVKMQDYTMYANTLDRWAAMHLWKFSAHEDFESVIIKDIVKPGMVVLDIGANIGYYTLLLASLVGPEGKVHAFEPELNNYSLLVKNIESNGFGNVIAIQKGVSNKTGTANLLFFEENRGNHRIASPKEGQTSVTIDTLAIDNYFSNNEHVDVIKIDVEGNEYFALTGMEKLIVRQKNIILITEFAPYLMRSSGIDPNDFLRQIVQWGFTIKYIDEKRKLIEPIGEDALISMCGDKKYVNLFLKRD